MQEITKIYLRKIAAKAKDISTHLPIERTTEQTTRETQPLPSNSPTQQKQTDHPTPRPAEKSKKHRIPFVAFALVMVFTSLCGFALLNLRPTALADTPSTSDNANPSPVVEVAPWNQTVSALKQMSDITLAPTNSKDTKCENFSTLTDDQFCWNRLDFSWGNRDITCITNFAAYDGGNYSKVTYNMHPNPPHINLLLRDGSETDKTNPPVPGLLAQLPRNQNTCTDKSTCVSDNRSNQDINNSQTGNYTVNDYQGGDDIICGNDVCTSPGTGTDDQCGDPDGSHLEYDKFGCKKVYNVPSPDNTLEDVNWNEWGTNAIGTRALPAAGMVYHNDWWSTEIDINPTAYYPNGAIYYPVTNLSTSGIDPIADTPVCDTASSEWACKNGKGGADAVGIYQYQGNFVQHDFQNDQGYKDDQTGVVPKDMQENIEIPSETQSRMFTEKINTTQGSYRAHTPGAPIVPVFWVFCVNSSNGWAFPCSDKSAAGGPYGDNMPFITTENATQSLDSGQVNAGFIKTDWFSGDAIPANDTTSHPAGALPVLDTQPGHLEYTYLKDTVDQSGVQTLLPIMQAIGFALIAPVLVLIGYQFLWASWTVPKHLGIMETLGRLILTILTIALCRQVATMLISLVNTFNLAAVGFHAAHPYQDVKIGDMVATLSLKPQGEDDLQSFRGVAVPISRWGCIANDFIALVSNTFWTSIAGFVPWVGGFAKFVGNVFNAIDMAKHVGEFAVLIFSISLCTQMFMRILLLNYYILTGPLVFACWGLPGGVGHRVVSSWTKGFLALLFSQTIQLFVLTTFPLILPTFPNLPIDRFGIVDMVFQALPRVMVLTATLQVPKLMGTQATRAVAQAGTVAAGVITAAGAAAMHVVQ